VRRTEERDEPAATRVLTTALRRHGVPEPITIDGREAHAAAIRRDNAAHGTALIIRQVHSRTTVVEPDQRGITRVTRPRLGCQACDAAQWTLAGMARRPMLKKGQVGGEDGADGLTPVEQFDALVA
jgi:putative transposase